MESRHPPKSGDWVSYETTKKDGLKTTLVLNSEGSKLSRKSPNNKINQNRKIDQRKVITLSVSGF